MPRAAKNEKTPDVSETSAPAFEDALEKLEALVREMESDNLPLDDLIRNYEEGTRLYHACEKRLDEAQGRIEIIRKKRNGQHVLENFGETPNHQTTTEAESGESQTHGELF
jgi:exodeoxyribonuclease VII small subunit